jgi:large subunit ribosomal protein L3
LKARSGPFLVVKMINTFFGIKKGQKQTFNEKGKRLVVSVIQTFPLRVMQVKTKEKDGYQALKVGFGNLRISKIKKSLLGEIKKAGLEKNQAFLYLREIKITDEDKAKIGDKLEMKDFLKVGEAVQVTGETKGRGFAGVVKRWGFAGGPRTHGQSDRERAPGSIGQRTDPGRVWKGKKMPGHMGNKFKTIKGLKVFKIDEEKNELWLTGLIPGTKGGLVKIKRYVNN